MSKLAKALTAAAGNAAGDPLYAEDVFSTYLYEGNSTTRSIVNGIDLDGEGGLVWIKDRVNGNSHQLADTLNGVGQNLFTNGTNGLVSQPSGLTAFNANGFSLGSEGTVNGTYNGATFASWTFRKAKKFFDVVTYSSDTTSGARTISHNLGSTPAFIIVKGLNFSDAWYVYHISTGVNKYLELNLTGAGHAYTNFWGVTDSTFTVDSFLNNNGLTGKDYVAYLFASDAGGFGDDGDESIIKCGSYVGSGDTAPYVVSVDLGFEPQWLLVKNVTTGGAGKNWLLVDMMRGFHATGADKELRPNTHDAENDSSAFNVTSTGFSSGSGGEPNIQGNTYIYIAIRRPMKTPESGTEVFNATTAAVNTDITNNFPADLWFGNNTSGNGGANAHTFASRLTGLKWLQTATTLNETTAVNSFYWDSNTEFTNSQFGGDRVEYFLKRATGFFDMVAYTGTGSTAAYQSNLGVPVEFVIVKRRDSAGDWYCWHTSFGQSLVPNIKLNSSAAKSSATLAVWLANPNLANYFWVTGVGNTSGADYISYHFATLDGVSKVGSYTGTAATLNVDCGFSAGARFILIKRTDSTGDWYVWDSARGIVAGNDPYLLLNSTAAEVTSTDYIDPLSSGFTVTSSAPAALNASGGTYIFLAIA